MKKFCTAAAAALCILCAASAVSAMTLEYDGELHEYDGSIFTLIVNDSVLEPPLSPIIFNDHALVPVREIFEELGADVEYECETRTVEIIKDEYTVSMAINDNVAYINGERTSIPDGVVPKLISEYGGETKTMVPVRFISESVGLDVDFNEEYGAILVESSDYDFSAGKNALVTDIDCRLKGENKLIITAELSKSFGELDSFTMKNPSRLVVDMYGAAYDGKFEDAELYENGIDKVRFGDNGERARIVVDSENIADYSVELTDETTVEITIITDAAEPTPTPTPAPIPSAKATPKPTKKPSSSASSVPDTEKLIVLDAGHGGSDCGAVGYLDGNQVLEKNLTLEITNKVKERLEERGYTVLMTRTGDTLPSLSERPAMANEADAAVFVSIHINSVANAPEANGTEVYYAVSNNGDEYGVSSKTLAENILERMLYYMGSANRGVKTAEHAVTKRCNMPASLVEIGFITNPTEVYNMTDEEYQYKAAQGIAEGIMITLRDISVPEEKDTSENGENTDTATIKGD